MEITNHTIVDLDVHNFRATIVQCAVIGSILQHASGSPDINANTNSDRSLVHTPAEMLG